MILGLILHELVLIAIFIGCYLKWTNQTDEAASFKAFSLRASIAAIAREIVKVAGRAFIAFEVEAFTEFVLLDGVVQQSAVLDEDHGEMVRVRQTRGALLGVVALIGTLVAEG